MRIQEIIEEKEEIASESLQAIVSPESYQKFFDSGKKKNNLTLTTISMILVFPISTVVFWLHYQKNIFQLTHFHLANKYAESTVGVPTIGQKFNFSIIRQKDQFEFESILAEKLVPFNQTSCSLGNVGGSVVCENSLKKTMGLINIGYNEQDNFGCALSNQHNIFNYFYGCQNQHVSACHTSRKFTSLHCVGEVTETVGSKHYHSIENIIKHHKLEYQHVILKMMVKRDGWASFRSLPQKYLSQIDQMVLSLHLNETQYWGALDIINSLTEKFYPVNLHMNNKFCNSEQLMLSSARKFQSSLLELTLVNKDLISLKSQVRSFKLHQANTRSYPGSDCQMPHSIFVEQFVPFQLVQIPSKQKKLHPINGEHVHLSSSYPYSTVGVPIAGDFFSFTLISKLKKAEYYSFILKMFKPFNDTNCVLQRYGSISDETDKGYLLCRNLMNRSVALLNIGISDDDRFGCELSSEFQIPNYQYDCKSRSPTYCRSNNKANIFSNICVGEVSEMNKEENVIFNSLRDIINSNQLMSKHITLKMDIGGEEWMALRSLPMDYLDFIDQIVIQMHIKEPFSSYAGNTNIIKSLVDKFYPVNYHVNDNHCWKKAVGGLPSEVFYVTLVNKRLLKLNSKSQSFAAPDQPQLYATSKKCQIKEQLNE